MYTVDTPGGVAFAAAVNRRVMTDDPLDALDFERVLRPDASLDESEVPSDE